MKFRLWWLFGLLFWLAACRPAGVRQVRLLTVEEQVRSWQSRAATVADLLAEADLPPGTSVLLDGRLAAPEDALTCAVCTIQVLTAPAAVLDTPDGETSLQAPGVFTLAQAVSAAGVRPTFGDRFSSSLSTPVNALGRVDWGPGQTVRLEVAGHVFRFPAAAETVADALALAGITPQGLDEVIPPLDAPLPLDGVIRLKRVQESLSLEPQLVPYEIIRQPDPTLEVDTEAVLQPGQPGLALARTRIRLEDGQEVARLEEAPQVIRPPQAQIIGYGTRIVLKTIDTPQGPLQYWRAVQMYATSYSPCRSAGEEDRCYYGTSSGLPVQKGVVAMYRDWYLALRGMQVYVPGYGVGVVADVGGGFPDGRPWIDLGYSDDDYQIWSGWVTVYFLAPAPAEIPWVLR